MRTAILVLVLLLIASPVLGSVVVFHGSPGIVAMHDGYFLDHEALV